MARKRKINKENVVVSFTKEKKQKTNEPSEQGKPATAASMVRASDKKQKTIIREVLEIVVVIAAAYIFYYGMGFALGTPTPMFSVVSESMEPTLHIGDMVIIQKADYNVGDIVVYMRGSIPIIHRIIQKGPEGYTIKGDNNPVADPDIVQQKQIVGKTIVAFPVLGAPRFLLYKIGI